MATRRPRSARGRRSAPTRPRPATSPVTRTRSPPQARSTPTTRSATSALTASYSGLVNSDTQASLTSLPTIITTATAASHVSGNPYSITASGAIDTDYTISYIAGTLTVTPGALTITADSKSKPYGAALPALTASYVGLVNGDTPALLPTPPTV